ALPIARFGTDAQQAVLAKVASGDVLLTAGLVEYGAEPDAPTTTATRDGDGWRIDGLKGSVAAADAAELGLVPAIVGADVGVFLVPTNSDGVSMSRQQVMNHEALYEVTLDGVRVGDDALLGGLEQGREVLAFMLNRTTVATCALVAGVADTALRMT